MTRARTEGSSSTTSTTTNGIRVEAVQAVRVWVDMAPPVIAAVHGVAVGGGFQLALGADLRVVAPDAQLGVFEIKWGIVPDMCGTQLLPRLVGPDVAKDLVFTGRVVTGAEAQALGLVTRLSDDPRAGTLELAREIASRRANAIKVMKRLVDASWTLSFDDGVHEEHDQTEGMIGSKNQLEAVIANLEQRPGRLRGLTPLLVAAEPALLLGGTSTSMSNPSVGRAAASGSPSTLASSTSVDASGTAASAVPLVWVPLVCSSPLAWVPLCAAARSATGHRRGFGSPPHLLD